MGVISIILQIVSLAALVAGLILMVSSRKYRTQEYPRMTLANLFNPKYWIPFWKAQQWFTPGGFRMYFCGVIFAELGAITLLINSYLEHGQILGIRF